MKSRVEGRGTRGSKSTQARTGSLVTRRTADGGDSADGGESAAIRHPASAIRVIRVIRVIRIIRIIRVIRGQPSSVPALRTQPAGDSDLTRPRSAPDAVDLLLAIVEMD